MFKRWLRNTSIATLMALAPLPSFAKDTPQQGGDIIVTYKDDIATLDPAIGYDWVNWSMIKSLYSRLMDYEPGTANLIPSLAETFGVSDDGLTYTFKLRKGVKFTNGREVVASDVKYSIERAVNPKTQGPGAGFFGSIKGYEEVTGSKTTTLEGIETPDDATVIFHLSRPDATFLHVLAINFASVVPHEAVEAAGGDFGKKPVGSGTFMLKDWWPSTAVLRRSPSALARPWRLAASTHLPFLLNAEKAPLLVQRSRCGWDTSRRTSPAGVSATGVSSRVCAVPENRSAIVAVSSSTAGAVRMNSAKESTAARKA
jgi:ABC-type transport system substrate-binding protein